MLTLSNARILVICQNEHDKAYLKDFFERIQHLPKPDFLVGTAKRGADQYDFIVFSGFLLGEIKSEEARNQLPEENRTYLDMLNYCLTHTSKYIVYFGKYYYDLNQERCPSANSKFTLFARIRELIEFINAFKTE